MYLTLLTYTYLYCIYKSILVRLRNWQLILMLLITESVFVTN